MSTPGKDNLATDERKWLNEQMKKASAKGNKSVQSASAKTEVPQLDSVNANQYSVPKPQTNAPAQLLSNEQIAQQRQSENGEKIEQYKKAQQEAKNQAVQQAIQQGMALPATERTVETSTLGPMNQKDYRTDVYDAAAARQKMEGFAWLKDMNDRAEALRQEYEGKTKEASRQAKTAAWGNLFSALGQLAGAGQNTYVKPDSKYLNDALSKVDKAKEVYEAIKMSNQKAIDDAKNKWMANDQELFNKDREAYNKMVKDYNDMQLKIAKETGTKTKTKYSNDDLYKEADLKIKGINAGANAKRADIAQSEAERKAVEANNKQERESAKARNSAYIDFKDRDLGKGYSLNESEALEIANKMKASKEYTGEKLGLINSFILGTLQETDRATLKSAILEYLDRNKSTPEMTKILGTAKGYTFETNSEDDL